LVSKEEKILLEILSKRNVVRRSELSKILENQNGITLSLLNDLVKRKLVVTLNLLGESSYMITREGNKVLKESSKLK